MCMVIALHWNFVWQNFTWHYFQDINQALNIHARKYKCCIIDFSFWTKLNNTCNILTKFLQNAMVYTFKIKITMALQDWFISSLNKTFSSFPSSMLPICCGYNHQDTKHHCAHSGYMPKPCHGMISCLLLMHIDWNTFTRQLVQNCHWFLET